MAVTITTTYGSASANSYADLEYANAYFAKRPYSEAWTNAQAEGDLQSQALLAAMRFIESQHYLGSQVTDEQALQWPRRNVKRTRLRIGLTGEGIWDLQEKFWPYETCPAPIKDAQCEVALAIIENPTMLSGQAEAVTNYRMGPLNVQMKEQRSGMPAIARRILAPFLTASGGARLFRA